MRRGGRLVVSTGSTAAVIPAGSGAQAGAAATSVQDVTAIRALPEPVRTWVLTAFTQAMDDVFLVAVPFLAVALVIALTMREKPLAGRTASVPSPAEQPEELVVAGR